jgi:2'-5' RNA ligase superfamily
MRAVVAIDIAILPPPDVSQRAIELSAQLPKEDSEGLLLGPEYLPHITLLQQFVDENELPALLERVDVVTRRHVPVPLRVPGGEMGSRSVWMEIERTAALQDLHMQIRDASAPFDRGGGDRDAFLNGDARDRDVQWVTGYRTASSGALFRPHITLGHAARPPAIDPFTFEASTIAACHLGRFCSCRRVLRAWTLTASIAR